jgi:hypothetical protein
VTPILLALSVIFMQFPITLVPWNETTFDRSILFLSDLPIAALAITGATSLWRGLAGRRTGPATTCWAIVVILLVAALAAHPSGGGVALVARAAGALAVAWAIGSIGRPSDRMLFVGAVAATAIVQAVLAAAQVIHGGPIGLAQIGEISDPLHERGGSLAPRGTMVYVYDLTVLALVAGALIVDRMLAAHRPIAWLGALALAVAPVGFTYSRSAAVGIAAGLVPLLRGAIGAKRPHAVALAAILVGVAIPAIAWSDGWVDRAHQSVRAVPAEPRDRRVLLVQAAQIVVDAPIAGVGPGAYLTALRSRVAPGEDAVLVHSIPVLLAAEAGVAAGVAFVVLLVAMGRRALRGGPAAVLLYLAVVPFLVLDHFLLTSAQGLALLAIWLGSTDLLAHRATSG